MANTSFRGMVTVWSCNLIVCVIIHIASRQPKDARQRLASFEAEPLKTLEFIALRANGRVIASELRGGGGLLVLRQFAPKA